MNILVTTLGTTWAVIPELEGLQWVSPQSLSKPMELWSELAISLLPHMKN